MEIALPKRDVPTGYSTAMFFLTSVPFIAIWLLNPESSYWWIAPVLVQFLVFFWYAWLSGRTSFANANNQERQLCKGMNFAYKALASAFGVGFFGILFATLSESVILGVFVTTFGCFGVWGSVTLIHYYAHA